jgi:hypothetical protein
MKRRITSSILKFTEPNAHGLLSRGHDLLVEWVAEFFSAERGQ